MGDKVTDKIQDPNVEIISDETEKQPSNWSLLESEVMPLPLQDMALKEEKREQKEDSSYDFTLLTGRLRAAMSKLGITQAQLARACNVKPPSVNGWLNGKAKYLKGKNLLLAAKALNVSQEWLATGKGAMMPYEDAFTAVPNLPSNEFTQVPVLNTRQSVMDDHFEEHLFEEKVVFRKADLVSLNVQSQNARVLLVHDNGMLPTLQMNCSVLIDVADTILQDTKVYAVFYDGHLFFRRLIYDFNVVAGQRTWVMRCDNPDRLQYPDRLLPPDVTILGRAVWFTGFL